MRRFARIAVLLLTCGLLVPQVVAAGPDVQTATMAGAQVSFPGDWLVSQTGQVLQAQTPDAGIEAYVFTPAAGSSADAISQGMAHYSSVVPMHWEPLQMAGDYHGLSNVQLIQGLAGGDLPFGVLLLTWESSAGVGALESRVRPSEFGGRDRELAGIVASLQAVEQ